MATDDRPPPDSSGALGAGSASTERTQVQTDDAIAASVELSIPKHVTQHPDAPKISGYVLCDRLGEGAYGLVWRSWQLRTRKELAVKVFMQRSGLDWIFLQREVERLTRLDRHPHIVTLLDTGLDEEPPYYAMDLIERGSLQRYVRPDSTATCDQVVAWLEQMCDALSYVHAKGLIHCDLKPANILVDGNDRARVVDFGQSRVFTESAASMGTLFYMAPEQAKLSEPGSPVQPDVRWDVYAVGATAYAILTGHAPHANDETVRSLESAPNLAERLERYRSVVSAENELPWGTGSGPTVGAELRAMITKCLMRDPDARYPTVAALAADLRALRSNRPISPLAGRMGYRAGKFVRRNPFLIGMIVVALGLVGAITWASVRGARLDRARAHELLAAFVHAPAEAHATWNNAAERVRRYATTLTGGYVDSPAYTERVMGARAALTVEPQAFWNSVDGGPLWNHGEWLEVARVADAAPAVLNQLLTKTSSGSTRERYVAFCLLGTLADQLENKDSVIESCRRALTSETDPGVLMAAWWAARKCGAQDAALPSSRGRVFVDQLTGLVFGAIPSTDSFRRGSPETDPDRGADEAMGPPVSIGPIFVATTEVTAAAFRSFLDSPRSKNVLGDTLAGNLLTSQFKAIPSQARESMAVGYLTADTAAAYCAWLNTQAEGESPARTYRLPTEEEWEYAARAGNDSRFCYGDDVVYAPYFAACNGEVQGYHTVATRMPNAFGLFDMHGGLWELTSSTYPGEFAEPAHRDLDLVTIRGGAYYSPARRCRTAQRNYTMRNQPGQYTGLRLILEISE